MPLEGLRWSRDSGSALYDAPQNGRSRTGWGGRKGVKVLFTFLPFYFFTFLHLNSLFSKQAEELSIYQVSNLSEVFRILSKLQIITINDDKATFIILDPILITLVQTLEVIDTDALLEIAATLLDMLHERRNAAFDIYHQVREFHQTDHQIEEIGIVLEIPITHHADVMKIWGEDAGILKDCTVLYDSLF